jgi:hypothetical protein
VVYVELRDLTNEPMSCEGFDENKLELVIYEQMLMEGAPPELTAEEIDAIVSESIEDKDNVPFLLYAFEDAPICPYCCSVLNFCEGRLHCVAKGCIDLQFPPEAKNIADVAWQMKITNDQHK